MKRNYKILSCFLFVLASYSSFSQTPEPSDYKVLKEGVVMRDGKVMKISKAGVLEVLEADLDLGGTTISKTGDVKFENGAKIKLKNGEVVTKSGNLMVLTDMVQPIEGITMKNGKLILVKDGTVKTADIETYLKNDIKVSGEGVVQFNDGFKYEIKEGEVVTLDGDLLRRRDDQIDADGVMLRNGKVVKWDRGKPVIVEKGFVMANGSKVSPDGVIILKDGIKIIMQEGDVVGSKGEYGFAREGFLMEGLVKRDGKIIVLEDGKFRPLTESKTLGNGSVVEPTGLVTSTDKNKITMKDGDFLTLDGELYVGKGGKSDLKFAEKSINDHLIFREGKMLLMKNGEPEILLKEIVMPNGAKVSTHGHIHNPDGTKIVLKEGQKMDMKGNIIVEKEKQAFDEKNHILMKGGKVYQVKDGKETLLSKEFKLAELTKVFPDGTLERNGKKVKLKEGERVTMDGDIMKVSPK